MAAIVINVPNLQKTFGVLLGAYLDDEPLRRGAHWAVAAISAERPDLYKDRVDGLKTSLEDSDPWIRGCAVLALAYVVPDDLQGMTEGVGNDEGELALYRRSTGELHPTTVGELVIQAVSGAEGSVPVVPVW